MEYTMHPVIDIGKLREALEQRYPNIEFHECPCVMWGDEFYNDSYKSFYFRESDGTPVTDEIYDFYTENKIEYVQQRNLICAFLCEVFPDFDSILVDVSW